MVSQPQLDFLLHTATEIFGEDYHPNIRLPKPLNAFANTSNQYYFNIPALWTRDGLRPRWDNLAAVADQLTEPASENLISWQSVVDDLKIPLVVLSFSDRYLFISSDQIKPRETPQERLRQELEEQRRRLFSPRSLGRLRSGQLTLADLEESLSENSFTYHLRHRAQLDRALTEGVKSAIKAQLEVDAASTVNSVIVTAIAYLAARILEDKGYFDNQRLLINDPKELLEKVINRTDGFFKQAYDDHLPHLDINALRELAVHIGNSVSFTLVDDHDIGCLYEQVMQVTQQYVNTSASDTAPTTLLDLQQHYTPQAIAQRMLNLLLLERLRPDERVIFDPAAGSGSLLVAATWRLALMPDVAMLSDRNNYLAQHVLGNDLDPNAKLITKLRYTLVQETFGQEELFPDPEFFEKDYHQADAWALPLRPRVIVANPPFAKDKDKQRAVRFVQIVAERLQEGDQFAIVLPQTLLTGTTYGWPEVRKLLSERCHILESWQLPEGAIGLSARQPVCIVLGVVEKHRTGRGTIARSIVSGAQTEAIRDKGFLGSAWVAKIDSATDDWEMMTAPLIKSDKPTISLGDLFYVCSGVTLRKGILPVTLPPDDIPVKRYWKLSWRKPRTLWADPDLPETVNERYILYSDRYLKRPSFDNEWVYDSPKIMVGRSINRGAQDPLGARLDTIGFCPNNDVYCVVPLKDDVQPGKKNIKGWAELSNRDKLLWLLGILDSKLAAEMSMSGRDARHLNSNALRKFQLPAEIDFEIIRLVDKIVQGEMEHESEAELKPLREQLDRAVEASYGNPERNITLTRTGTLPDLELWEQERK